MIGRNRRRPGRRGHGVSGRLRSHQHRAAQRSTRTPTRRSPKPLTLDYEFNDPADPESIYTRSDHYSYAAKGIPIIFFTTGLHPDYHADTDEVSKIEFDKMARITQLVYETGTRVANLDHAPVRDNKGPRRGRGAGEDLVLGSGFGIRDRDRDQGSEETAHRGLPRRSSGVLRAKAARDPSLHAEARTGSGFRVRRGPVPSPGRTPTPNPDLRVLLSDELTTHGAAGIGRRMRVEVEARGIAHDRLRVHLTHRQC